MKLFPPTTGRVIYLDTETPLGPMRLAAGERTAAPTVNGNGNGNGNVNGNGNGNGNGNDKGSDNGSDNGHGDTNANVTATAASRSDDDFPALSGAWFLDQSDLPAPSDAWVNQPEHPVLRQAQTELAEWFAGQRRTFDVPLAAQGTDFQRAVWRALLALPFGTTTSYSDLALSIGKPKAVRAAAQAVGRNPISIFIPCHRIIGRDTSLTGFGGGLERKQALLKHEGHRYLGHHPRVRRVDNGQLDLPW